MIQFLTSLLITTPNQKYKDTKDLLTRGLATLTPKVTLINIKGRLKKKIKITKQSRYPTRSVKNLWGQWNYNRRWRNRNDLPSLSISEFLTKPQKVVRRWFFRKKCKLSGKKWKKKYWAPFIPWTPAQKRYFGQRRYMKMLFKSRWLHTRKRLMKYRKLTNYLLYSLTDHQRGLLATTWVDKKLIIKRFKKWPRKKRKPQRLKVENLHNWGKQKKRKVYPVILGLVSKGVRFCTPRNKFIVTKKVKKRVIVSPLPTSIIDNCRSKELEYALFSDNQSYLTAEKPVTYSTLFSTTNTVDEDLPIFALDLYNLYLYNLENERPVSLQQWVTRSFRKKTNKRYKKLLVEYTTLLESFYAQVSTAKVKKKTATHNAVLLIKQFSRVAGARTANFLNKRCRFVSVKTLRFFLRHKHFKKFWRTKKSLVKMQVVMSRMLMWLYNTPDSKYLLGVKLRQAFFQNYETNKRFIYKKKIKLHLKTFKNQFVKVSAPLQTFL